MMWPRNCMPCRTLSAGELFLFHTSASSPGGAAITVLARNLNGGVDPDVEDRQRYLPWKDDH